MTTTHRITHALLEGNVTAGADLATRADVERLAQTLAERIAAAFPGYEVEVPVQWKTSGAGPRTRTTDDDRADEIRERVHELSGEVWQEWCESIGCSVEGCELPVYANAKCEAHDRRARRGSSSTAPVRARGTETLRSLSLRVPERVYDALGREPGSEARKILERWSKRTAR